MKEYLAATRHRAAQFGPVMTVADAEALCAELNAGRDPNRDAVCVFNGSAIYIMQPGQAAELVPAGNWIVIMPNGTMDIHADADFCSNFCSAAAS
jgi:hypothetical protein